MVEIGGINIAQAIVDLELRAGTLERLMDLILIKNPGLTKLTQQDVDRATSETIAGLKQKYPHLQLEANK